MKNIFALCTAILIGHNASGAGKTLDYRSEQKAKRKRWLVMMDESRKLSQDPDRFKKGFYPLCLKFIDTTVWFRDYTPMKRLAKLSPALISKNPEDPFSLLVLAHLDKHNPNSSRLYLKLYEKAESSPYLSKYSLVSRLHFTYLHLVAVRESGDKRQKEKWIGKLRRRLVDDLAEWLQVDSKNAAPPVKRLMFRYVMDILDLGEQSYQQSLMNAIQPVEEEIDPWILENIKGCVAIKQAWRARGCGFADTVPEAAWEAFHSHLSNAEKHFEKAHALHPELPESAAYMIKVAMAVETDLSLGEWYRRSRVAQIDHQRATSNMLWALRPRWGGSHQTALEVARLSSATDRFDTQAPYMFIQTMRDIAYDSVTGYSALVQFNPYPEAARILKGYLDYQKKTGRGFFFSKDHMPSTHFAIAMMFGEFADAYALFNEYGKRATDPKTLAQWRVPTPFMSRLLAANGPAKSLVPNIDKLLSRHNALNPDSHRSLKQSKQLLRMIQQARVMDPREETKPYFDLREYQARKEVEFGKGKWADLEFEQNLNEWILFSGNFKIETKRSILVSPGLHGGHFFGSKVWFAPPYEIEVEVEWPDPKAVSPKAVTGIICGRFDDQRTGRCFGINGQLEKAAMGTYDGILKEFDVSGRRCKLRALVWEDTYEFIVDGHKVPRGEQKSRPFSPHVVSFGAYPFQVCNTDVRYSNIRVRKITERHYWKIIGAVLSVVVGVYLVMLKVQRVRWARQYKRGR